jgi:hypothetical protein
MKDINGTVKLGDIDYSPFAQNVDADLFNTGPIARIGFQSLGSSPFWIARSSKPAARRASSGKFRRSSRLDPTNLRSLTVNKDQLYKLLYISQVKLLEKINIPIPPGLLTSTNHSGMRWVLPRLQELINMDILPIKQ